MPAPGRDQPPPLPPPSRQDSEPPSGRARGGVRARGPAGHGHLEPRGPAATGAAAATGCPPPLPAGDQSRALPACRRPRPHEAGAAARRPLAPVTSRREVAPPPPRAPRPRRAVFKPPRAGGKLSPPSPSAAPSRPRPPVPAPRVRKAQPQGDPALRTDTCFPPAGAPEKETGPFPCPPAPGPWASGAFRPSVWPAGTCPAWRQLS